jgi:hypothetical protein
VEAKRPPDDVAKATAKVEAAAGRIRNPARIAQVCSRFPQARSIASLVCH